MKKENRAYFSQRIKYLILAIVSLISLVGVREAHAQYGIYYGTDAGYAKTLYDHSLLIVQDYNLGLFEKYNGQKICYLSIGESTETIEELKLFGGDKAILSENKEWKSFIMDMSHQGWKEHLLKKVDILRTSGCNGLFLDTLWQEKQEKAATELIKNIRKYWIGSYIIANNAHQIKDQIIHDVDGFMFEDFGMLNNSNRSWNLKLMREYKKLTMKYKKDLFALNYSSGDIKNSIQKRNFQKIHKLAVTYGFNIVFADKNLNTLYR